MPDLPAQYRRKYRELGLPAADVLVLADELPTAQYFDEVLAAGAAAKPAANWIMGDIMAFCKVWLHCFLCILGLTCSVHTIAVQAVDKTMESDCLHMKWPSHPVPTSILSTPNVPCSRHTLYWTWRCCRCCC